MWTENYIILTTVLALLEISMIARSQSENVQVLYPWRLKAATEGLARVRRAWVIPPIAVSENSRKIPFQLVQIKSDKLPSKVIYSIKGPGVDEDPKGIFTIDPDSGFVFLTTVLDREEKSSYKIKAYAVNETGMPLEEPTDLEIIVIDQNDNRPTFDQQYFIGHVLEGSPPGTLVMRVTASDADDPQTDNAALGYSIVGDGRGIFRIDPVTGEIRTVGVGLDRENISVYNLTLQVADLSGEGLSTTATAVIFIDDINDNAPEFTATEFTVEVSEDMVGSEIGHISVVDKDQPGTPNWLVDYTIIDGNDHGLFSMKTEPETNKGILFVEKGLDYEKADKHILTVEVKNKEAVSLGAPQALRSSAKVIVIVTDVNEAPRFVEDPQKLNVPEGLTAGSFLTVYTATDPDTKQQQNISYGIQYDPADWLMVDMNTGEIFVQQKIERGSPFLFKHRYTAVITATDSGEPPYTATGTLEINVTEVNDFPPILYPQHGFLCSQWDKDEGVLLWAMDGDLEPHADPFHFEIVPDDSEYSQNWTIGHLNDTHSKLRARQDISEGTYSLQIRVSDSGQPRLSQDHVLNVTICLCSMKGDCTPGVAAILGTHVGLSFGAAMVILGSVLLLLFLILLVAVFDFLHRRLHHKGLLTASEDDIRDNILNYDEQGGGEEDQDAYNIDQLRNPDEVLPSTPTRGKQPIRRDAPFNYGQPQYPKRLPANPNDIKDFINEGLDAADNDPNAPPYDTALIYDYEGEGSLAETLSSITSRASDSDQDYDYLSNWGPRFKKLADMYGDH
ncbi:cadherin-15 [Stegostoma tigrinum]|uniref:cadherin-15 n=1 Tax=Stegostoma tigrinum TaxID=3053191 RepID=UPI00202AE373|nr:cadherin-15 [Stegostoma tigrinum]